MASDRVGILIVSKCLSAAAMIDTFSRSEAYSPEFYIAEKQPNPFNVERAKTHQVIPDLDMRAVARFAKKHSESIAFGLTDTEDFVIGGGRDLLEREAGVQMICVTRNYAIERSKADQRQLFQQICPEANPRFIVIDPEVETKESAVGRLRRFSEEVGPTGVVIKPDAPARGAGVGVWGSDFRTDEEMAAFFALVYSKGRVVVEERVEGEESSFHAFSDGSHFIPAPLTRDYKRSLEGGEGSLTGGMGSYRDTGSSLPFLPPSEWERVVRLEEEAFRRWKGKGSNPGLRGIVLYDALMHSKEGVKILERNSRGGNTEQMSLLTTIEDDLVDICYRMLDGGLRGIRFSRRASVVTCAVPLNYGLPEIRAESGETQINLDRAYAAQNKSDGRLRVFPMDVRLADDGRTCLLGKSRSVAVAGIGSSVEEAREVSLSGVDALDGPLRYRSDLASSDDIRRSAEHLRRLRGAEP